MEPVVTAVSNQDLNMFTLFEMTPDLVCIAGKDGYFRKVNPAVINKLGFTEEELFSRPISSFIHPADKDLTSKERISLLEGKTLLNFQNRYVSKTGDIIWLSWTSVYFPQNEIVFAIAKDITENKRTENDIIEKYKKFKGLAKHFKTSIEEDRKYLAVELHEELAQLAAVIKMDMEIVRDKETGLLPSSKSRVDHAIVMTGLLIDTIRRISFSISPRMLDDIGLNETLKWHCREFSILNGIPCVFESTINELDLTHEAKLDFFRICQDALSNVMYHAQANNVSITIEQRANEICMLIRDDGKGFDINQVKESAGLVNMRERAISINGQLTVDSEKGKGTLITVAVKKQ